MAEATVTDPNRVRCLGPLSLKHEHWFASKDRVHNRMCKRCQAAVARMAMGTADVPVKTHDPSGRV